MSEAFVILALFVGGAVAFGAIMLVFQKRYMRKRRAERAALTQRLNANKKRQDELRSKLEELSAAKET